MRTTERALKRFAGACLREAKLAELTGDPRLARNLRRSVSDVLAENRSAMPAPAVPVDHETAKRRAEAHAKIAVLMNGLGRPQ